MASTDRSNHASAWVRVGAWLHRHFLVLLLICYGAAVCWPNPGQALRGATLHLPLAGPQRAPMLMLALLLFCAAVSVRWSQAGATFQRPSLPLLSLMAAWLGPVALVIALGAFQPLASDGATSGLLAGLALVAAMPVANSSAGWSQNSGGNVAFSLALVVISIVLSPLVTPQALRLMGMALSSEDTERLSLVVREFSGWSFIIWVVLPSLAGAGTAWLAGASRVDSWRPWLRLATLIDLLLLNYANASLALQEAVRGESWQTALVASCLAVTVSVIGVGAGALTSQVLRLDGASRMSLLYGASMKHTGLALVLAGQVLDDERRVILLIVLATLAQHIVAAGLDWRHQIVAARGERERRVAG